MIEAQNSLAEILNVFREECRQFFAVMRTGAAALASGKIDTDMLASLQRAVHSAKGGAGAFGYVALHRFAHMLEDALNGLRNGEIDRSADARATIIAALDVLAAHIATVTDDAPVPDDSEMLASLRALLNAEEEQPEDDPFGFAPLAAELFDLDGADDASLPWCVLFAPSAADLVKGREPLLLLRELACMCGGMIEPDIADLPPLHELEPRQAYVGWTIRLPGEVSRATIEECLGFISPLAHVAIERDHTPAAAKPADGLRT